MLIKQDDQKSENLTDEIKKCVSDEVITSTDQVRLSRLLHLGA